MPGRGALRTGRGTAGRTPGCKLWDTVGHSGNALRTVRFICPPCAGRRGYLEFTPDGGVTFKFSGWSAQPGTGSL